MEVTKILLLLKEAYSQNLIKICWKDQLINNQKLENQVRLVVWVHHTVTAARKIQRMQCWILINSKCYSWMFSWIKVCLKHKQKHKFKLKCTKCTRLVPKLLRKAEQIRLRLCKFIHPQQLLWSRSHNLQAEDITAASEA